MEITATFAFAGPSVHARGPATRISLGELERWPSSYPDRALLEELGTSLPGLAGAWSACPEARSDRSPAHLLEHVCVELLRGAGAEVGCVRGQSVRKARPDVAVIGAEEPEVCIAAARLGAELLASLMPRELPSEAGVPVAFPLEERMAGFLRLAERTLLPVQDRELVRSARACGVPVVRLTGRILQLGHGRHQQRLSATKTSRTNVVSNDLAANKDYARRLLVDLGLPVPRYERVTRVRDAVEAARRIGYPVVVKPNNGSMGDGVSVGMRNRRQVREAFERARALARSVLVEELVEGGDFRMLVIDGELQAASQRIPAHVTGDGKRSIEELVERVNSDPRRGSGPRQSWTRIELDERSDALLADRGYDRGSVPPEGEVVLLRRNANTSDGGTAVDVTDRVHPDNREIAERTARAIGLDVAGVDFLTSDISRSMWETGGKICEVNSRPGLRKHIWPAEGTPRDVTTPIVRMLYPAGAQSRVPVVAILDAGTFPGAGRRLADVLASDGHRVGLVAGHRAYVGGRHAGDSRLTPVAATRRVLLDPDVDVVVLELSPDDVVRHGLGCDAVDVAVVPDAGAAAGADAGALDDAVVVLSRAAREVAVLGESGPAAGSDPGADVARAAARCLALAADGRDGVDTPG